MHEANVWLTEKVFFEFSVDSLISLFNKKDFPALVLPTAVHILISLSFILLNFSSKSFLTAYSLISRV